MIASIVDGTHVTFAAITANAHTSGDKVTSSYTSFSQSTFEDCHVFLTGNQPGVVGWRIGHTDLTNTDFSFLRWGNCGYDAASVTSNTGSTGQIGWANEGSNSLNHYWFGGYAYYADKVITNNPTTGSGSTYGGGSLFVYGIGTSHTGVYDFEFVNFGSYLISGGRFELGAQLLAAGGSTVGAPINVTFDGIECEAYSGIAGVLFGCEGSTSLNLGSGYIGATAAAAQWTSAMISFTAGSSASQGALVVKGMHLSAAEPFANFATGNWSISLRNNTQLTSANAVTAHFNEFEWITTQTTAGHDHVYFGAGVPASNSGANVP